MAAPARGISVKDVPADAWIAAYARYLKRSGKFEVPKWADMVKTAHFKELGPLNQDWYYVRAASVARRLYIRGNIGIGGFRKVYGGKKRNGTCPGHFALASGSIIRHILHSLEKLKVVEKDTKGGRKISNSGTRDLDRIAGQVAGQGKKQ